MSDTAQVEVLRDVLRRARKKRRPDAVTSLPLPLRLAVELCHYQGLPTAEAAEQLGISPERLQRRLVRASKRLRIAPDKTQSH